MFIDDETRAAMALWPLRKLVAEAFGATAMLVVGTEREAWEARAWCPGNTVPLVKVRHKTKEQAVLLLRAALCAAIESDQ